jgi:hypothetical protein
MDRNSGSIMALILRETVQTKGTQIEDMTCAFVQYSGMNFEEYLAQILRRKLVTVFKISL